MFSCCEQVQWLSQSNGVPCVCALASHWQNWSTAAQVWRKQLLPVWSPGRKCTLWFINKQNCTEEYNKNNNECNKSTFQEQRAHSLITDNPHNTETPLWFISDMNCKYNLVLTSLMHTIMITNFDHTCKWRGKSEHWGFQHYTYIKKRIYHKNHS